MRTQQGPRPARPWRIAGGVLLLLMLVASAVWQEGQPSPPHLPTDDIVSALGALFGIVVLLAAGILLIRSGLPRR